MTDSQALVVLNAVPGFGPAKLNALLESFDSPSKILAADYDALQECGRLSGPLIENLIHFSKDKFLEREYNLMQQKSIQAVTRLDEDYPCSLNEVPGAPFVLYVLGDVTILSALSVAIVGSRIAGPYGQKMAGNFASAFAQAGLTVVSGLARGIDTAAHRGCLKSQGKTVAVIGCGLNHLYPLENKHLYAQIVESGGAIVTEYPMDTPPVATNFPRRNRIISGLSAAVVVVDAAEKSGALITADYALEQGRDVFAIPGPIDSMTCGGSNRLIKDGAKVALTPGDVLEEICLDMSWRNNSSTDVGPKVHLTPEEHRVFNLISLQPIHLDQIALQLAWELSKTSAMVMSLELKQVIRLLPGQYYVRT